MTVYSGKVDLGTGIHTAMTQIAAEELSVPLASVTRHPGRHALTPDQGVDVRQPVDPERRACRSARRRPPRARRCSTRLAAKLGRRPERPQASRTASSCRNPVARASPTPSSSAARTFELSVDAKAPLKDPKDYTIVGKPVARIDIPDKVTGRFTYMQDFRRRACCTRASCGRRDEGDRSSRGTTSTAARFRATFGVGKQGQLPRRRSAQTNGRAIKASQRSKPSGRIGTGLPNQAQALGVRARHEDRQGRRRCRRWATPDPALQDAGAKASAGHATTSRSTRTARSVRHARSPSSTTASSPSGAHRSRRIYCASRSRTCSA